MGAFQNFLDILEEMAVFFSEAASVEMLKINAVKKNRITYLEDCMKKEQVMIMKLRSFDKKRESIQADLGYGGLSLKQIGAVCSLEERARLMPVTDRLDSEVRLFCNTLDNARKLMEVNLHKVNSSLAQKAIPNFTSQTI